MIWQPTVCGVRYSFIDINCKILLYVAALDHIWSDKGVDVQTLKWDKFSLFTLIPLKNRKLQTLTTVLKFFTCYLLHRKMHLAKLHCINAVNERFEFLSITMSVRSDVTAVWQFVSFVRAHFISNSPYMHATSLILLKVKNDSSKWTQLLPSKRKVDI